MGIQAPAEVKFRLIYEAIQGEDNQLSIRELCAIAQVSRSGYYAWVDAAAARQKREESDLKDFALIKAAYDFRGYKKGARAIHMRLLHLNPPVQMNLKKIRRLMRKYGLKCPFRRPNPYKRMAKAMMTSHVAPNVLDRQFKTFGPRRALLTDITYLFYENGECYLTPFLDVCTHQSLAHELSESLKVDFVLAAVDGMLKKHGAELDNEVIVHSDQGCHYTSNAFIKALRDADFVQSMSRKGNCWDNSPQESFFGHMKDEIQEHVAACKTFEEVKSVVDDWMDYYNKDRYQWDLEKLSPDEYYQYLLTGIYPLSRGKSKNPADRGVAPDPKV